MKTPRSGRGGERKGEKEGKKGLSSLAHVGHHLGRKETTNFLALWPAPCFPTSGPRGIHRMADGMSILSHMRCLCEMERKRGGGSKEEGHGSTPASNNRRASES
ncbi:hypothetical protein CH63R_12800 [Colletotrichum higginsianum IMI 349063]|uniref:Uncharacterized protein n=1 Tax=Colletotrichum higginsianum (strain IMI 349063) TaxID=759273 RepID=A0A1B7XVA0_COLHI|nr:hypothetical protein CH63R_12800 [Colletotrichum higginsianum IMI 349063]OBR03673.1 hypothetical protein CH63R_12800 [Colletotrichum higginsianum IMI 349063]